MTRAMLSEVSDFRSRRSRTFRVLVWCVVGAMVLLAGAPVNAQPFETVGVRTLGMGGAFVAVADDATANYWNPAGLTDLFFSAVLDVQRTDTRLSPDPFLREGTRDGTTFVSTSAERALETYAWPGNVREFENVIERAVALEEAEMVQAEILDLGDIPGQDRRSAPHAPPDVVVAGRRPVNGPEALPESGFFLEQHIQGIEREYLAQALQQAGGVKVRAVGLLGMSFRSFRYYLKKYHLG